MKIITKIREKLLRLKVEDSDEYQNPATPDYDRFTELKMSCVDPASEIVLKYAESLNVPLDKVTPEILNNQNGILMLQMILHGIENPVTPLLVEKHLLPGAVDYSLRLLRMGYNVYHLNPDGFAGDNITSIELFSKIAGQLEKDKWYPELWKVHSDVNRRFYVVSNAKMIGVDLTKYHTDFPIEELEVVSIFDYYRNLLKLCTAYPEKVAELVSAVCSVGWDTVYFDMLNTVAFLNIPDRYNGGMVDAVRDNLVEWYYTLSQSEMNTLLHMVKIFEKSADRFHITLDVIHSKCKLSMSNAFTTLEVKQYQSKLVREFVSFNIDYMKENNIPTRLNKNGGN